MLVDRKKSARPISQISQASCKQKLQHTYKDGMMIPYPLIHQNPHRWRMPAGLVHNEQQCIPQSRLSYDQSSSSKAGPIKPVLVKLANQVQQKSKMLAEQVYVLRDKKVLTNPIDKDDEQIIIKISSADAPIKETKGPIVIDNLDQSNVEKISSGIATKDDDAQSSISAPENLQPTWCPLGLSRTLKRKLQRARYKKLKQEGLANMGKQIFDKMDPILPQSSEKELAAYSKSAELMS